MIEITYTNQEESRSKIRNFIIESKNNNKDFRVIDIGGNSFDWTSDIIDFTVDLNSSQRNNSLNLDICKIDQWIKLLSIVQEQGKFDYCVCTHTLEDVYNPFTTLDLVPKIANSGVIITPSIRTELSRIENINWLGYIHHRWIFDQQDNKILIIPKLSFLERLVENRIEYNSEISEICFEWEENIPYSIFMDNYLGPNSNTVIDRYFNVIKSRLN